MINPSDEALWNLMTASSNQGEPVGMVWCGVVWAEAGSMGGRSAKQQHCAGWRACM